MNAAYTPGPWRISEQSPTIIKRDFRAIGDEGGELVASASGMDNSGFFPSKAEGIANARLIAAAPDLLEHLQHAVRFFDQLNPADVARYRAVIAKATGGAS